MLLKPSYQGVLLGEPSLRLIDVDLDHPLTLELAASYLPPTNSIFGRTSKPRSHWLYYSTEVKVLEMDVDSWRNAKVLKIVHGFSRCLAGTLRISRSAWSQSCFA